MTSSELAPLLVLHNRLKQSPGVDDLVESQVTALEEVTTAISDHPLVSLVGPEGVGKTFIAWVLCKEFGYQYHRWPVDSVETAAIVVDDAPADRVEARSLRARCRMNDVDNCMYITHHRISGADTIPSVRLRLNADDERSIIDKWGDILDTETLDTSTSLLSARRSLNMYSQ